MTLELAQRKLKVARTRAKKLREHIYQLRQIIMDHGVDPDHQHHQIIPRNKEFYRKWKDGLKYADIAREFGVSDTLVGTTCRRITATLKRKSGRFYDDYKELARYKGSIQ